MTTQLRCLRAELLLERRGSGLSPADALRLEDHLAGCERCSEQARLLNGLCAVMDRLDTTLSPQARERAIVGAFAAAHGAPEVARPLLVFGARTFVPALVLAAGFGLALGLTLSGKPVDAPSASTGRVDRVLSGQVEVGGRLSGEGTALAETSSLQASAAASVALAQARVELRPGTQLRWQRAERRVLLDAGSVRLDVDPAAHQSFTVETPRFRVLVLGTRFEVTLDRVSVERGRVRVVDYNGRALSADLGPGASYVLPQEPAQTATVADVSDAEPELHAARDAAEPVGLHRGARASGHERASKAGATAAVALAPSATDEVLHADAAALLDAARRALVAKRLPEARRQIEAVLALATPASLRAEALSLRADCAQVEGDRAAAIAAYSQVAQSFAALPAGENALFAAARLEQERGGRAAATAGLRRYLARYPRGRFVKEAQQRLRALGVESSLEP